MEQQPFLAGCAQVVLQGFHRSSMAEGDYDHRLKLQARIIGFR